MAQRPTDMKLLKWAACTEIKSMMYTLVQFDLASRVFQAVQSLQCASEATHQYMHQYSYCPHMHINLLNVSSHHKPYHIGTRVFKGSLDSGTPKTMTEESIKGFCNVACFEKFTIVIGSRAIHVSP